VPKLGEEKEDGGKRKAVRGDRRKKKRGMDVL